MKFKSFLKAHKSLVRDIVTSTCLLGGSAGIVFGVSAGTFHIQYMKLNSSAKRYAAYLNSSYNSERINSEFNMNRGQWSATVPMPSQQMETPNDWISWHPSANDYPYKLERQKDLGIKNGAGEIVPEGSTLTGAQRDARKGFTSMIIDGASHVTMDRSFNQQLFEGLADFNNNKKLASYKLNDADSSKPSQDNPTEFINIYNSVMQNHYIIGLAGFNHATPLTQMMTHINNSPYAECASKDTDKIAKRTSFVLLDANVSDNQNVASVQFRADQPGFLSALAVCDYFYHNLQIYHNHYQNISVGTLGGIALPTVLTYMGGFQRGIELFDHEVLENRILKGGASWWFNVEEREGLEKSNKKPGETFETLVNYSKYKNELKELFDSSESVIQKLQYYQENFAEKLYDEYAIKIIRLGEAANHFSGTFAAGDAIGLTKQFLNRGASALIVVAGPQSLDAAQEIQNQNSKCVVIGVDTAMEDGDYQRYHQGCSDATRKKPNYKDPFADKTIAADGSVPSTANGIIKFSAVKDIKSVTRKMSRLIALGQNWDIGGIGEYAGKPDPGRAICGPGFQTCGNLKNGLVSISWDGFYYLLDALEHLLYGSGQLATFAEAWPYAVDNYRTLIGEERWEALGVEYTGRPEDLKTKGIYDFKNIETFNRYNANGEYSAFYNNYTDTIGIIAQLLSLSNVVVHRDMSLWPVDEDDLSKGFREMDNDETKSTDVMTWLDYNMYFTS